MSWRNKLFEYLNSNYDIQLIDDELNQIQSIVEDGLHEYFEKPMYFRIFDHQNKFVEVAVESHVLKFFPLHLDVLLVGNTLKTLSSGFCAQVGNYLIVPQPKIKIEKPCITVSITNNTPSV